MTERRCDSCKHWHEQADGYAGQKEGFGVCENAQHIDDWNIDTANTMMAVIDGEDYFAALLTKPGHSCAAWIETGVDKEKEKHG